MGGNLKCRKRRCFATIQSDVDHATIMSRDVTAGTFAAATTTSDADNKASRSSGSLPAT